MTPPPLPRVVGWWGGSESIKGELSTYRRAGVHHSQETRGTHKDRHRARGERKTRRRAERGRGSTHETPNTTKREAVDTSGTVAVRDDTLWPSRRR